jgi:uncharacterized protein (DUF58 family)
VFLPSVRPRETVPIATVRTPARRGPASTGAVEIRSAAPFGVAERRRRLDVDGARTLVLPMVHPLGDVPFLEPVGTTEPAAHPSPRLGTGPDYLSVREYRAGDAMRHVHWALTARHGRLMVREFEEERTRRLAIVVDTERDAGEAWTPLDRCCSVAASLVDAAGARGTGARLVAALPGGNVDVVGRSGLAELLGWLAMLAPSGRPIEEVLDALGPRELRGVERVVVAFPAWPGWDPASVARAADRLAQRASGVVLVPVLEDAASPVPEPGPGILVRPWRRGEELAACLRAERVRT